jgi:hypothetical protein
MDDSLERYRRASEAGDVRPLAQLDGDGLIREIRPHLRPWLALTLFALTLGPRVARRPGVLVRALRAGSRG